MPEDVMVSLGHVGIDGREWQIGVKISPIGELTLVETCLETAQQRSFLMDAVAAHRLHETLVGFYQGEFEKGETE